MSVKNFFRRYYNFTKRSYFNIGGWSTNRKLVVIESDDWGMIRTHSKKALSSLKNKGYPVDGCSYNRFDSLERNQDVNGLLEVLAKYKGPNNKLAKFTLNNVVANPHFDKIHESRYQQYFYQPFVGTLKEFPDTSLVMDLYQHEV